MSMESRKARPQIDNTIEQQKETEYWIEYTYWSRLITFSTPSWPDEEESDRRALWIAWASSLFSAIDGALCFSSTEKKPCLPPSKITLIIKLRLSARDSTSKFLIVKMLTNLAILVKQNEKEVLANRALKKQSRNRVFWVNVRHWNTWTGFYRETQEMKTKGFKCQMDGERVNSNAYTNGF